MTYEEARAFINDTAKYGYVLGLDTERELLRRLEWKGIDTGIYLNDSERGRL